MDADRNFWAFISYSHSDEAWAKWLHSALERYRVPKALVGRSTARGIVPSRLLPIFRDRDELPGSSSLTNEIGDALTRSRTLIVICSPKAAVSRYVGNEVVTFKRRGRESDILCLLVDGEPNATDKPESGNLEALPPAIRYKVNADGAITDQRAEPLAADVRPGKDTRVDAKLKIVAGLLGVGFDELKRRESRRQLRRRVQIAAASLAIVASLAGVWWNRQHALEGQQQIALSRALARQSAEYAAQRPDLSSLLAVAALDVSDTLEARDAVFAAATRANQLTTTLRDPDSGHAITVKFSPDGRTLAAGTREGRVNLWDAANVRFLGGAKGHRASITALTFNSDGRSLASGSEDGTVVIWNAQMFSKRMSVNTEAGRVFDVAFDKDGENLRTVSERASILWRISDGTTIARISINEPLHRRNTVHISPDGSLIGVSADWLGLWDAYTDKPVATLKPAAGRFIQAYGFSSKERALTTLDNKGTLVKWNTDTGQKIGTEVEIQLGDEFVNTAVIAADATLLAVYGKELRLIDPASKMSKSLPISASGLGECLAIADDGGRLAWCGGDGTVELWDSAARSMRTAFTSADLNVVGSVAFNQDGTLLASGDTEGRVIVWDTDGRERVVLKSAGMVVSSVAFNGNDTVVAGIRHGPLTVWNLARPENPIRLPDAGGVIGTQVASSSGSSTFASATSKTITLWDTKSWNPVGQMQNEATVRGLAFSRDGTVIAAANGADAGSVSLWDAATRTLIATLKAHRGEVMGIAFSADGTRLASAGRDGSIVVWDVRTKTQLSRFDALDEIYSIAFSPDGKLLAHGGDNGRLVIRDVDSFQQIVAIREHRGTVSDLAISPDGRSLASTDDRSIIVWHDFDVASWKKRACRSAGRNLTKGEWNMFVGEGDSRVLCPEAPRAYD